ncbi:MAG: histidinol-phosphatase HisJ family protein [bacterium]
MQAKSLVDCHTHSSFSMDSQADIQDGIVSAINNGLAGLIFTDHLELDNPTPQNNCFFDFEQRSKILDQAQETFAGKAKVLKGVEVGFQPHLANKLSNLIKGHNFDFVICSTHIIDACGLGTNDFYKNKTKKQAYSQYLEAMYHAVDVFNDFDVVGHIGYICRGAPYQDKSLRYIDYKNQLDKIFKKIIEKDKGIEVNTAGYFCKLDFPHPDFDSIKRYKELGGHIITLGSDAHHACRIGDKFDFVVKKLKEIGFESVSYFENRKQILVKI